MVVTWKSQAVEECGVETQEKEIQDYGDLRKMKRTSGNVHRAHMLPRAYVA
jgi:hypothetical protein